MPEIPEVPSGWPAYITLSYLVQEQATAEQAKIESPLRRGARSVFAGILTLTAAIAFWCAGIFLVAAIQAGTWEALVLLAIVHLPWVALWKTKRLHQARYSLLRKDTGKPAYQQIGPAIGFPVQLTDVGVQHYEFQEDGTWKPGVFQSWGRLHRFEYLGESGRDFRIRLWGEALHREMNGVNRLFSKLGMGLLLFSPPILTVAITFSCLGMLGIRGDTQTAACLSIFYGAMMLLFRNIPGSWQRRKIESLDYLVDNTVVTANEVLTFLEKRIVPDESGEVK